MLTYLLPTHNRPERLRQTLERIGSLGAAAHDRISGAEVIVVDNASDPPVRDCCHSRESGNPVFRSDGLDSPLRGNDMMLRIIRLQENIGAAARNIGVNEAQGDWIVMLDDDSYPLDTNHIDVLLNADDDIAAIGADIFLPDDSRESGGLPEVFIGCGVAIRREAFLQAGGYDPSFDYYAEEYDLCAKLILNGWRIIHDQRFRVQHEKVSGGRDMDRILHRLVRNNGWVMQRYAPPEVRTRELAEIISRYARIAIRENAACGFAKGMAELLQTLNDQPRREMPPNLFDRFTGLAHVRQALTHSCSFVSPPRRIFDIRGSICLVDESKNAWAIRRALQEHGVRIVEEESEADALMIGTLSPGPMLDAYERRIALGQRVMMPWTPAQRQSVDPAVVNGV